MNKLVSAFLFFVCLVTFITGQAEGQGKEKKEVELKGKITCAKCDLGVEKACATVIVVKKDKADVTYYFDAASHKKHHGEVCSDAKEGSVKGVLSKDGKKNIVSVKELTFK